MTVRERRQREQAERRELIITAARRLAEQEGWDAVTTRRLAEIIEYSQPVLYQHFANKEAIVQAVALVGFAELAQALAPTVPQGLGALVRTYLAFAATNPVLYEAMFILPTSLDFGTDETPEVMIAAFAPIMAVVTPIARDRDPETLAEVLWSGCHGLASLANADRLRPEFREARIELFVAAFLD